MIYLPCVQWYKHPMRFLFLVLGCRYIYCVLRPCPSTYATWTFLNVPTYSSRLPLEEWPDLTNKRSRKVFLINFVTNTTIAVPFSTSHAESAIKSRGFWHCESDQSNRWKIPFPFSLLLLCDGCWATLMTLSLASPKHQNPAW